MNRGAGISGPRRPKVWEILEDPQAAARRLAAIRTRHGLDETRVGFVWEQLAEVPDPDRAVRNLEKLAARTSFPAGGDLLSRLLVLFGSSQFLTDVLLQNSEFVAWLGREGSLQAPKSREDLVQELAQFHFRASTRDDPTILRQFKDREYLRIALRDYLQIAEISETTAELSDLADVLLEKALRLTEQELVRRFGRPQFFDPDGKLLPSGFAVIGLGKLGGRELNYSSDIDLLFLFSEDGETSGDTGRPDTIVPNREWFTRLAEGIVERIGSVGPAGHVFRIDMELRPGGRDGELVQSLKSALSYYRVWGKGWERQALLKARRSAGDEAVGRAFLEGITAIIHGETQNPGFATEVARVHRAMQDQLSAGDTTQDLKHGHGGIRQLELSVQALQLLHSGAEPWLREGNTLRALHRLSDKGLISAEQHDSLARAYSYLRRVEHRLQLPHNRQTFRLPDDRRAVRILARSMGYRDDGRRREGEWFLADLRRHRDGIHAFFQSVLGERQASVGRPGREENLFLDPIAANDLARSLADWGFHRPEKTLRPLNSIRKVLLPFRARPPIEAALREATPAILRVLAGTANPSRGWRNLDLFVTSLARQPDRMERILLGWKDWVPVVDLMARSDLMADLLVHRQEELEGLAVGPDILQPRLRRQLVRAIRAACRGTAEAETYLPALCRVQRRELLRIGFRDLQGGAGVQTIQRSLSDLADGIVSEALYLASLEVHGRRRARRRGPEGFAVLALGRLATRELGYLSDLDILFLRETPAGAAFPFHQEHRRVAERLIEILSTITQHGYLYEIDMRLRPSGGEGELTPTLDHILDYFDTRAEVWERQSFLRTRPVAGDLVLARRALERIAPRLFADLPSRTIARRMADARARLAEKAVRGAGRIDLKLGSGGILEVLFVVQFLQLTTRDPRITTGDPLALLTTFRRIGVLGEESYRWLHSGYRFLRDLEHNIQLITGRRSADISFSGPVVQELAVAMDCGTSETLLARLAEYRHEIRRTYEATLH